jgi:hypothetical protein
MFMCYVVDKGKEGVAATCTEELSCISLLRTVEKTVDHTVRKRLSLLRLAMGSLPIQNRHLEVRSDMGI